MYALLFELRQFIELIQITNKVVLDVQGIGGSDLAVTVHIYIIIGVKRLQISNVVMQDIQGISGGDLVIIIDVAYFPPSSWMLAVCPPFGRYDVTNNVALVCEYAASLKINVPFRLPLSRSSDVTRVHSVYIALDTQGQ